MSSVDVTVFYNQHRVDAMERALRSRGSNLTDEITRQMDALYQRIVPEQERADIEDKIRQEEAQRMAEVEASRRFALVHLHDADMDYHLLTELHDKFIHSARLYRLVTKDIQGLAEQGRENSLTELNRMRLAYMRHEPLTPEAFAQLVDNAPNDYRIQAMVEFDFEDGMVSVCQSSDNHWGTYKLSDVSTAVFYADRKSGLSNQRRAEIFESHLMGKEIEFDSDEDPDDTETPALQM